MKRILILFAALVACQILSAQMKDYKVTVFGAKTDGITDNTYTIQKAIDFISENGGGNLWFHVGRYVTGSIELKDNVHLVISEGAVLVAPSNFYKYRGADALIWAKGRKNVAVIGMPNYPVHGGVIEMDRKALNKFVDAQIAKGYLLEDTALPTVLSFKDCEGVVLHDFKIIDAPDTLPYTFTNCSQVKISEVTIYGDGIILTPDSKPVKLAK